MTNPNPNHCQEFEQQDFLMPTGWSDSQYSPPSDTNYHSVQTMYPNDNKLSCAQLKVVAWTLAENVAQMTKSIAHATGRAQTHSQMAQVASVIAPSATAASAGMQMMSSSESQQAGSIQQIRDSQQKHHDFLMQIYFQKRCDD
ncbi:MAG TPA: hypothetical protein VGG45_20370 [Terracidiphilus sp.]